MLLRYVAWSVLHTCSEVPYRISFAVILVVIFQLLLQFGCTMLFYCRNIILCSKNVACVEIFDELNGFGIVHFR